MELLIYLAILTVLIGSVSGLFLITLRIRARENGRFAVNENARVALGTIRDAVLDADTAVTAGGCPGNELTLTNGGTTTIFRITNGALTVQENADPAAALTAATVTATTAPPCLFTKIENPPPAKPTVQMKLRLIANSTNPTTAISQEYQLTVSLR